MAISSTEQMRRWQGPAIFTYGFRPFFFLGSVWAGLAMVVWILALTGTVAPPSRFDPISWHAHAFIFGYLSAIIAGFLLTAVPNWTGRLPVVGWRLAGLTALWILGRAAVFFSTYLPAWGAAMLDLLFPVALSALILREIIAGRNWRNLIVLVLLAFFALANFIFHMEAYLGDYPAQGVGLRLSLAAAIMMIGVVGGRIIPSFTRNWLVQRKSQNLPVPPMQRLDKTVLLFSIVALLLWVLFPDLSLTGVALFIMGAFHLVRLARWKGVQTGSEALVAMLHLGYLFVPLGAFAVGAATLLPNLVPVAAAQHLWLAGAVGAMTLAVMTRATLGHTGHKLHANGPTVIIYAAIVGSTLVRFIAGFWPGHVLFDVAGTLWIIAFIGYAIAYGPMLLKRRS